MKVSARRIFCFCVYTAIRCALFASERDTTEILILHSYNPEFKWTENQNRGMMEILGQIREEHIIFTEYLDWKRFPSEANIDRLHGIFREKFRSKNLDLILTTDDRALKFAVENRTELFSDAPIVFSGVFRAAAAEMMEGQTGITGIYEDLEIGKTLEYARNIRSDTEKVYMLNETTESGQATEKIMKESVGTVFPDAETFSLSGSSLEEIEAFVPTLDKKSILVIGSYFVEKNGRFFSGEVLAGRISRASSVPVFTIFTHIFGSGALGGSMVSGERMGINAGGLALKILAGEKADNLLPYGQQSFVTIFDYEAVRRFKIPLSALPKNAAFINREPTFFEQYQFESLSIAVLFVFMFGFINILLVQIRKTRSLAYFDQLTALPNRTSAIRVAQKILSSAEKGTKCGLLFLDIDNFKYINDTFGHEVGDKVLIHTARTLETITDERIRVSRFGGDEFLVLIPNTTYTEIGEYAQLILSLLSTKITVEGWEMFLTASTGIAVYPDHAQNFTELLQNADSAMYRAKSAGKSQCMFFDDFMFHELKNRMDMETGLRTAFEKGEITVLYQPQINLKTGKMDGVEALVRWKHPKKGFIAPDDFIPVAEETGQIEKIGLYVLHSAAQFIKKAAVAGLHQFTVSVNVSVKQMYKTDFVEQMLGVISSEGIQADRISLEITESILMESSEEMRAKLAKLKKIGFKISLDDFGTGYSSLTYLRFLPINYIKIDKSFIDDMFTDERSMALASTIITIGHDLGLLVIAEGVESREQMLFLRDKGCDNIQGYYFSRPVTEEEIFAQFELLFG